MTINNNSIIQNQSLQNDNLTGFTSITSPTVTTTYLQKDGSWVSGDNSTDVDSDTNIYIQFSEAMDTTSITVNTNDTNCSGTLQVSKADSSGIYFRICVQMTSSPSASNNDKTFTLDPNGTLDSTTYKIRVTTGVKDDSGNSMSSQFETGDGFGGSK